MYNIDGDPAYGGLWGNPGGLSNGFFGCLMDSDEESNGDDDDLLPLYEEELSQTDLRDWKTFGDFLDHFNGKSFTSDTNSIPTMESEQSEESEISTPRKKKLLVSNIRSRRSPIDEGMDEPMSSTSTGVRTARFKAGKPEFSVSRGVDSDHEKKKISEKLMSVLEDAVIQPSEESRNFSCLILFLMHTCLRIAWTSTLIEEARCFS